MIQEIPGLPIKAKIKTKFRISPFWLLPLIAFMIASWLIWNSYNDRGTMITIDFISADGIVPGRTPLRYQGVQVGTVENINLTKDLNKIEVQVSITGKLQNALRADTQFWLVTPKASFAGVSGLDALVGGNYIAMMPGKGIPQNHFTALDSQPRYRLNNGELMIHLHTQDLGSLNSGSLVYFRKIPVGRVDDYTISNNKQSVTVDILIDRRFTNLVKKDSRFWNVSGIKTDVHFSGAKVQLESLAALVNGAIAFDSPEHSELAQQNDEFNLYEDLAHSQRGMLIKLDLPDGVGLKAGVTPLIYQGLEVGQLSKLTLNPDGTVSGDMTVDPSVVHMLCTNTRIELHHPKFSLVENTNLSALLTGSTFELVPGEGKPRDRFVVLSANKTLLQEPGVEILKLTAPESYGIDSGQPLILHGIKVGQVLDCTLSNKGIVFIVAIDPQYRNLIHGDSVFLVNNRMDVKVGIDGVQFLSTSVSEWINGGIRILPGSSGAIKSSYPLYANLEKAKKNSVSDLPSTTLVLIADTLPDIQVGSVVLYHKFEVGEVVTIHPKANVFNINLYIKPEYRNLLTANSVFWAEGGAKVQLNGSGLTVQTAPLSRALKGAISFDHLSSANAYKSGKQILYPSETAARAGGGQITLYAFDASKLSVGMPIRSLGINIGQIQSLDLLVTRKEVQIKAVLYPKYVDNFARSGTRFSVVTPQISTAGIEHLDTIFQPYINVELGRGGKPRRDFELQDGTITDSRCLDGLSIILEAPEVGSISIGTPVLFRGIEVGTVIDLQLGSLFDRVRVVLRISKRYQHLVRNNSVFWLASGYSFNFGLLGSVVKTGTFNQFVRGGIAFMTPPGILLSPKAQEGKTFFLQEAEPKEWRTCCRTTFSR